MEELNAYLAAPRLELTLKDTASAEVAEGEIDPDAKDPKIQYSYPLEWPSSQPWQN